MVSPLSEFSYLVDNLHLPTRPNELINKSKGVNGVWYAPYQHWKELILFKNFPHYPYLEDNEKNNITTNSTLSNQHALTSSILKF